MDIAEMRGAYDVAEFMRDAQPVLQSARVMQMDRFIQHGGATTLDHTMAVAYCSVAYARAHHMNCDEASLLRGALLHDYFLYDWHEEGDGSHRLHGFRHPARALRNAEQDFALTDIERDIIGRHMFPLVPVRPRTVEGRLVSRMDKRCSLHETLTGSPVVELRASCARAASPGTAQGAIA